MAPTAPRTWVTDENPSAATLNTHIRDNMDAAMGANGPHCRVYNSAAISISNVTPLPLTFDSERHDSATLHSTATSTGRITVPTGWGGLWSIGACIAWATATTGYRQAYIRLNGTTNICDSTIPASATVSVPISHNLFTQYRLSAGDYLDIVVYQSSGAALDITASANYSPEFWAEWSRM